MSVACRVRFSIPRLKGLFVAPSNVPQLYTVLVLTEHPPLINGFFLQRDFLEQYDPVLVERARSSDDRSRGNLSNRHR